jgi:cyclic pyranopterin phosphate synthase
MAVTDQFGRELADLRISVTDRCNFRCRYCMPREVFGPGFDFLDRSELLSFEEITRLAGVFATLGVGKLRLTGGEPLVRRDLETLVGMLAGVDGIEDIAMTTNASLLAPKAQALADAGLSRVTVSLDSVDPEVFAAMADTGVPLTSVLEGIEAAKAAGLGPVKVNAVVKRGVNDDGVVELARYGRQAGVIVRFIEYMDVGTTNGWRLDEVVPSAEVVERINDAFPIEPVDPNYPGEVADRWAYTDGAGEVGVISSVTEPFCATCTRGRLSAIGELYTCLFGAQGADLRALLRGGADGAELAAFVAEVWGARTDRYSELRTAETATGERTELPLIERPKVEMSYIGG